MKFVIFFTNGHDESEVALVEASSAEDALTQLWTAYQYKPNNFSISEITMIISKDLVKFI